MKMKGGTRGEDGQRRAGSEDGGKSQGMRIDGGGHVIRSELTLR